MSGPARDADLRAALERVLAHLFGAPRRIGRLERRPSPFRTSFALEELDVVLEGGKGLPLLFKDLGWQGLLEEARAAKPSFLHDPRREVETYRSILGPAGLGTAVCYGAFEPEAGRYWLFLERVAGRELYRVGDLAVWQRAARWLAGLHTHFAGRAEGLARAVPLLRYDADFYRLWVRRALTFARAGQARRGLGWLAERYDRVVERLAGLPATLLHGEFYASNVLVREGGEVCPVDWEMAAVGPGLMDLAALTAGKWNDEQRSALAGAYREGLAGAQAQPGGATDLLDWCRLQVAVQWLGWSENWSPPADHAQDWLGLALGLAERLLG
jgi:hypothetical protein